MKRFAYIILSGVLMFFIQSCEKDSTSAPYNDEIEKENIRIQDFIQKNNLTMTKTESGLYFMSVLGGEGESPQHGDFVMYEYNIRLLDSTLVFTTDSALAMEHNIYDSLKLYGVDKRKLGRMTQGESEALTLMKENGKFTIIVPFDLGYGEYNMLEKIPPYSTLLIDLYLKEVIKDPVDYEQKQLDAYIENNPGFEKLADGIYYKEKNKGNDNTVNINSLVEIAYTMRLLDGRLITSEKTKFYNGNYDIRGLNLGISQMQEKERGLFVLRSDWAFGDNEKLLIPPYSSIIIDIDVLKVD